MTSPTPSKCNNPRTLVPLDYQATSPRKNLKTYLKHDKDEMKFSFVDTALLNIKPKFPTPPESLRLRGGLAGFPNRVTIVINIPPIGPNQNQQEGHARGLNLGLFKQGTDLIKSVKDEKALAQEAYGTAKEVFNAGIPKFNADTLSQGYQLFENVKQQKNKIQDVVGNAQQISDSLGIDIKGDPRQAVEKLKKGYETYQAVKNLQSEPFNAGNLLATGGALFKTFGVGSRSAHISDLPLQSQGNVTCPPCHSRRGRGGVGLRSANISESNEQKETLNEIDRLCANLRDLLGFLQQNIDFEKEKCMETYKKIEEHSKISSEKFPALEDQLARSRKNLYALFTNIYKLRGTLT